MDESTALLSTQKNDIETFGGFPQTDIDVNGVANRGITKGDITYGNTQLETNQ